MASVGYDALDNATALAPANSREVDYAASLTAGSLRGQRLGVLTTFFNRTASNETTPVNQVMDTMISRLQAAGAIIVPINESIYNVTAILAKYDTQRFEYRELMNSYLQRPSLHGTHPQTLNELYATSSTNKTNSTGQFLVIPAQYEYVTTALKSSTSNTTYNLIQSGIHNLTLSLHRTFTQHNLSALLYPQQKNLVVKLGAPSQAGRNGILAALTGSPVVTVPAGFSEPSEEAPVGVPVGMEILGRPWSEESLLQMAWQVEMLGRVRRSPIWAREVVEVKSYETVPVVKPNVGNIPRAYPLGTL